MDDQIRIRPHTAVWSEQPHAAVGSTTPALQLFVGSAIGLVVVIPTKLFARRNVALGEEGKPGEAKIMRVCHDTGRTQGVRGRMQAARAEGARCGMQAARAEGARSGMQAARAEGARSGMQAARAEGARCQRA